MQYIIPPAGTAVLTNDQCSNSIRYYLPAFRTAYISTGGNAASAKHGPASMKQRPALTKQGVASTMHSPASTNTLHPVINTTAIYH